MKSGDPSLHVDAAAERSRATPGRRLVAMEVPLLVAERDGPEMLARIAVMKG